MRNRPLNYGLQWFEEDDIRAFVKIAARRKDIIVMEAAIVLGL